MFVRGLKGLRYLEEIEEDLSRMMKSQFRARPHYRSEGFPFVWRECFRCAYLLQAVTLLELLGLVCRPLYALHRSEYLFSFFCSNLHKRRTSNPDYKRPTDGGKIQDLCSRWQREHGGEEVILHRVFIILQFTWMSGGMGQ
jgi:hypothetical protein